MQSEIWHGGEGEYEGNSFSLQICCASCVIYEKMLWS